MEEEHASAMPPDPRRRSPCRQRAKDRTPPESVRRRDPLPSPVPLTPATNPPPPRLRPRGPPCIAWPPSRRGSARWRRPSRPPWQSAARPLGAPSAPLRRPAPPHRRRTARARPDPSRRPRPPRRRSGPDAVPATSRPRPRRNSASATAVVWSPPASCAASQRSTPAFGAGRIGSLSTFVSRTIKCPCPAPSLERCGSGRSPPRSGTSIATPPSDANRAAIAATRSRGTTGRSAASRSTARAPFSIDTPRSAALGRAPPQPKLDRLLEVADRQARHRTPSSVDVARACRSAKIDCNAITRRFVAATIVLPLVLIVRWGENRCLGRFA